MPLPKRLEKDNDIVEVLDKLLCEIVFVCLTDLFTMLVYYLVGTGRYIVVYTIFFWYQSLLLVEVM